MAQLETVDIIISSTGAKGIILHKEDVKSVMRSRKNKPLFFIDIAVPRDLDPKLNEIENVYLYDIDDLSSVVEMNRAERDKEAVKATRIVEEENLKFERYYQGLAVTPTILELRQKVENIGAQELEKTLGKLSGLSDSDRKHLEKMISAINAKVLHNPLMFLKADSCMGRDNRDKKVATIRELFGLED